MALIHLPNRHKEEQLRKQLAQEQKQQEAKAQQGLRKQKQEEDKGKKGEQTQIDTEVRSHYKVPGEFFALKRHRLLGLYCLRLLVNFRWHTVLCKICCLLYLSRGEKPNFRLRRMQSVSAKTENCRRNKKRRRGS